MNARRFSLRPTGGTGRGLQWAVLQRMGYAAQCAAEAWAARDYLVIGRVNLRVGYDPQR